MCRWDWYQTTLPFADPQEIGLVSLLLKTFDLSDYAPAQNRNGYTHGGQIFRGSERLCTLLWGGNSGVNVASTSEHAPALAEALQDAYPGMHRPTRVDSCMDWVQEGLFDDMAEKLKAFALDNRLAINQQGDWVRGRARTLYLGSNTSPVRLMLYEKGYEQGGDAPLDWVRLEVRVKPARKHRESVAYWQPMDAFGAAWVPDSLRALGFESLKRHTVGTVYRQSDEHRARAFLIRQYGAVLASWAKDLGGFQQLGTEVEKEINSLSEQKKRRHDVFRIVNKSHLYKYTSNKSTCVQST